jgi:hypothetical protein
MTEAIAPVSYQLAKRDPDAFVRHFAGSFERHGFAVVSDHELPQPLIDGCLNRVKQFFALPGCISPDRPNRYPEPILADDYLREWLREIKLLH